MKEATTGDRSLPNASSLEALLRVALDHGPLGKFERLIERQELPLGTAAKEFVAIELADGRRSDLMVKYGHDGYGGEDHRHGLAWEIAVYRKHLPTEGLTIPALLGTARRSDGRLVAVYERILDAVPLAWDSSGLRLAARWLGRFHRLSSERMGTGRAPPARGLPDVDPWIAGALESPMLERQLAGLLSSVRKQVGMSLRILAEEEPVLVHGEFYPKNLLIRHDTVWVVDWESATLGFPEIDLASLIENWSRPAALVAIQEYSRARWEAEEADDAFATRLSLAQLYWALRWLPQRLSWLAESGTDEHSPEDQKIQWSAEVQRTVAEAIRNLHPSQW